MRGGLGGAGLGQFGEAGETGGGSAEGSGDVEQVSGPGARAEQGSAPGDGADQHDVGQGDWRFGQVAAG